MKCFSYTRERICTDLLLYRMSELRVFFRFDLLILFWNVSPLDVHRESCYFQFQINYWRWSDMSITNEHAYFARGVKFSIKYHSLAVSVALQVARLWLEVMKVSEFYEDT